MKLPSDAQAAFLALLQERNEEGHEVEWMPHDDYLPSRASLRYETIDRDANTSTFHAADDWTWRHRVVTVEACERLGWISLVHERTVQRSGGYPPETVTWLLRQIDLTEDGVIALGLWRERKLKAPPPPLPTLSDREREIVELAARALELGYALCACESARKEAKQMRDAGWWNGCWVANSVSGLVPSPLAVAEVFPDRADQPEQPRRPA